MSDPQQIVLFITIKMEPGDHKKAGVAILISDKIDFEIKAMKRDKEGQYRMIKGSIQEEDITIINIYAPNIGANLARSFLQYVFILQSPNFVIVIKFSGQVYFTV